jgi:hypothetical protein
MIDNEKSTKIPFMLQHDAGKDDAVKKVAKDTLAMEHESCGTR